MDGRMNVSLLWHSPVNCRCLWFMNNSPHGVLTCVIVVAVPAVTEDSPYTSNISSVLSAFLCLFWYIGQKDSNWSPPIYWQCIYWSRLNHKSVWAMTFLIYCNCLAAFSTTVYSLYCDAIVALMVKTSQLSHIFSSVFISLVHQVSINHVVFDP